MPEDFSSGGTPVQAGVLDFSSGGTPLDFAGGGTRVKKTREQVMAEVGAAQGRMDRVNPPETLSRLEKVGNAAYWPTRALSGQDFLPMVENVIAGGLNQTLQTSAQLQGLPQYPQEQLPYQGGRPIIPIESAHDPSVAPVDRALLKFIEGLTTPANVALLPLGGMQNTAGKVVASTFVPPMVQGTVEQGQAALNPELPTGDRQEAAVSALLSGLMTMGLGKQMVPRSPVPSGMVAPDTRNPIYDRPGGGDLVGPERQLPAPGERPTPIPGVPMDRPAGAARFGVDVSGRAVDVSQLTPKEQVELYRGPKEGVARETYVRPARGPIPIIGEQQTPTYRGTTLAEWNAIVGGDSFGTTIGQTKNPVTGAIEGGQKVDSTWTIADQDYAKRYASRVDNGIVIEFKPEAKSKMSPVVKDSGKGVAPDNRLNGKGLTINDVARVTDASGKVIYEASKDAKPEAAPKEGSNVVVGGLSLQQKANASEVVFQNETAPIKPVYVPSRPPVEPSGGEISFRAPASAEGIPNAGQSAPKGMQIKAAMERGQERRGETGSVFPQGDEGRVPEQTPKEDLAAKVRPMTGAQFREWSKSAEGGITAEAHRYGMGAKTQAQVDALKEGEVAAKGEMRAAMESGDMDGAMSIAVKGQFFREAHEAATGVGSAGEKLLKDDAGYKAPFPQQGGVTPVELKSGGIGSGMQKAVEKNKEGGSIPNPFPFIVEKFKKKEKEKRGDTFALSGPRIALDPKESGFQDVTKKVDAQQLWNRVKNKLTPAERDVYEKSGVDKEIVAMGKVSPEEAAQMLQDRGPEVRVESYGMEGKVSEAKREYDRMTHEWYDNLNIQQKNKVLAGKIPEGTDAQVADKYIKLREEVMGEIVKPMPRATSAYSTVSALDTTQPMPEWTKSKSGKNVQRVDVVVPRKELPKGAFDKSGPIGWRDIDQGTGKGYEPTLWQPDNLHENLPNTLGWAMIQYKDGPKGEKIAVVAEAQSRWGQDNRERVKTASDILKRLESGEADPSGYRRDVVEKQAKDDHPLLRDYNRLILKAAIDQARKEGATHIMLSDAETAMMTEGHDAHVTPNQRELDRLSELRTQGKITHKEYMAELNKKREPEQAPGMRLNYDTILPKIAEELTGSKGERVSVGEHKNAFDGGELPNDEGFSGWPTGQESKPRQNLIFKNPDGTPKTDVSGTLYPLPKTEKKFSVFEKDRPEQVEGRLYMNPIGPVAKQAAKDLKKLGNGIKETAVKLKDYYKGAEDLVMPDLVFQNNNPLPDFQPKEIANKIFSQPFGSEKIPVLGRMMGGKARIRTPQDEAVAAWYGERHGVGPAVASSVGEQIRGQVKGVFKVDEKGNLNVRGMSAGQSLKMSDVFEGLRRDPLSYDLTTAQRKVFKQIVEPITKRMAELAKKYDIIDEVVDDNGDLRPYFPRIVTKHPKLADKKNSSAFKTRAFNTEKEGWDRGYEYELDPEKRLVTGVERLYRAIANKRLASDPILGAKSEVQVKAEIKQAYADKLATGEITQSKIDRIAEGIRTRGQVMQPILIRSIFDPETAKMLNKEFAAEQSTVRNAITSANSLTKATQLGFDLGVGQIQLLPLLYYNTKVWSLAIYDSAKGMANPEFFSTYVRANKEAVNELAQLGSSVGRLQEHMSGLGGETLLGKTPILGDVAQAFGRQFQTAMDVAKVELWKSLRDAAPKKEWPKLVRSIETVLLSGRSESAMVPHGRALLERVALLAPSYYRGAVEHIAALGERGASGKVVRQSMGRFILGSAITFYAVAKALQMNEDEIKEGFNPMNTSFMTWKVKQEDESVVNIGFGGIFRSFLKLGADVIKVSREHPENWKSLASDKNPLTKWYRGHSGPTPSMVWDGFSGEDFLGRDTSLETLAKGRLPLLVQEGMRNKEEPKATALDYGASTFGLSTRPESFGSRRGREQEDAAMKQFGKEFKNLSPIQRSKVDGIVDAKTKNVPKGITKERSRELAMKLSDERVQKLQDGLSEEAQAWLKGKGVEVGGYQSTMSVGGKQIRLTKEEGDALQVKMVSAYENTINKLMAHPNISKKEGAELQRYVNVHLENARKKVWGEMVREISKNSREKQGQVK